MKPDKIKQLEQASLLIYKGLNSKALPDKDTDYKKLIAKWHANEIFRNQVDAIAKGLRLKVADISDEAGAIILPLDHNSAFRYGGLTKIRKSLKVKKGDAFSTRGAVVLGLIALLATFFRDELDIDEHKENLQTRTVSQIASVLLEICKSLKDQYEENKGDIPEYLCEGWKVMLRLSRVKKGKASPNSVEGIIIMLANQFVDEGLLVNDSSNRNEKSWFVTQRFIAQAENDTATGIYEYCMKIHQNQMDKKQIEDITV